MIQLVRPRSVTVHDDGLLDCLVFSVPGVPVPKGRPRGRARLVHTDRGPVAQPITPRSPRKTQRYEADIAQAAHLALHTVARASRRFPERLPLRLVVTGYWPRPMRRPAHVPAALWRTGRPFPRPSTPDFDNVAKVAADALNGLGIWTDDAVITDGRGLTRYAGQGERPRLVVVVDRDPEGS